MGKREEGKVSEKRNGPYGDTLSAFPVSPLPPFVFFVSFVVNKRIPP
jgi:hypothetical protein